MKAKIFALAAILVVASAGIGLALSFSTPPRDEYDFALEIAKMEAGFVRFGPRDDPLTQIEGTSSTYAVSTWIELDRSVQSQRLPGAAGTMRRTCTIFGQRPDLSPMGWYDKIHAWIFPARSMASPGYIVYDHPDLTVILKSVRERRGRENLANLIQDIGWALGYVAYEEKPIKFDLMLLRAQIEHEAGRDDLARQTLKLMAHKVKTPDSRWHAEWKKLDVALKP